MTIAADVTHGAVKQMALVETFIGTDGFIKVRDSLTITPSFGAIWYTDFDLGFPDVRASAQENPQADGTYDETRFMGARSVSLSGLVLQDAFGDIPLNNGWDTSIGWNSASWWLRKISAWANPSRRFRLYFTDDSGLSRFVDVRGDSFSSPIDKTAADYRAFQLGFINPSGKIYSFSTAADAAPDGRSLKLVGSQIVNTVTPDTNPGRPYPEAYPKTYPVPNTTTTPPVLAGGDFIDYQGTVANGFLARIRATGSAIVNPRLRVTAPDGSVQSIGITTSINPGTTVTFDTSERTITQVTAAGVTSSLEQFKTAPLQWPTLKPGITVDGYPGRNRLNYTVAPGSPTDANIEVLYYNADLD